MLGDKIWLTVYTSITDTFHREGAGMWFEVRALCRTIMFLHTRLEKSKENLWSCFVDVVMFKRERDKHKLLRAGSTLLSKIYL